MRLIVQKLEKGCMTFLTQNSRNYWHVNFKCPYDYPEGRDYIEVTSKTVSIKQRRINVYSYRKVDPFRYDLGTVEHTYNALQLGLDVENEVSYKGKRYSIEEWDAYQAENEYMDEKGVVHSTIERDKIHAELVSLCCANEDYDRRATHKSKLLKWDRSRHRMEDLVEYFSRLQPRTFVCHGSAYDESYMMHLLTDYMGKRLPRLNDLDDNLKGFKSDGNKLSILASTTGKYYQIVWYNRHDGVEKMSGLPFTLEYEQKIINSLNMVKASLKECAEILDLRTSNGTPMRKLEEKFDNIYGPDGLIRTSFIKYNNRDAEISVKIVREMQKLIAEEYGLPTSKFYKCITIGGLTKQAFMESQYGGKDNFRATIGTMKLHDYLHLRQWVKGGYGMLNNHYYQKECKMIHIDVRSEHPYCGSLMPGLVKNDSMRRLKPSFKDFKKDKVYFIAVELYRGYESLKKRFPSIFEGTADNRKSSHYIFHGMRDNNIIHMVHTCFEHQAFDSEYLHFRRNSNKLWRVVEVIEFALTDNDYKLKAYFEPLYLKKEENKLEIKRLGQAGEDNPVLTAKYETRKYLLNTLYGKLLEKDKALRPTIVFAEDNKGALRQVEHLDEELNEDQDVYAMLTGAVIVALSRGYILSKMDRFDEEDIGLVATDSLFIRHTPANFEIVKSMLSTGLGGMDLVKGKEYYYCWFLGEKAYQLSLDNETCYDTVANGIYKENQKSIKWKELIPGYSYKVKEKVLTKEGYIIMTKHKRQNGRWTYDVDERLGFNLYDGGGIDG